MNFRIIVIIIVFLAGCTSSGFNRVAMKQALETQKPETSEDEIIQTLNRKAEVQIPFKLGIYFDSETPVREFSLGLKFWEPRDKEGFLSRAQDLVKEGVISEAALIPDLIVSGSDVKSIRLAGAKKQLDTVLIIKGIDAIDNYANPLAFFYLTIVGMGIFPGSHQDSLVILESALWDVRTGQLYYSGESEGEDKIIRPLFYLHTRPALERAKLLAIKGLFEDFHSNLLEMKKSK